MSSALITKKASLYGFVMYRSFSRSSAMGLQLPQGSSSQEPQRSWVNASCFAAALLGLSLSLFSTRQLTDDPNRQCLLWRK
ncbi:hypothetical protein BaRGS_00027761 [Batillaria attramentaria]|uniref:Uncharacterized protein n=1 Tax=Batillaria attramentaria TaxID=370345 RepID=A0ABD0K247_9CAEN